MATPTNARRVEPKDAIRVAVGVAALGWAGREAMRNRRQPKVFGVRLPRELDAHKLAKRLPRELDAHKLAKQVEKAAEQLERTSEDVRMISAQAKRLSKRLG